MAKQQGFMLLELLLAAGILLVCVGVFAVRDIALQTQYQKLQVRMVARALAADIRQLQQQALFQAEGAQVFLTVGSNKQAYSFKSGSSIVRTVKFASLDCAGVYFSTSIARLAFSKAGNPTASGSYILQHEKLKTYRCQLLVQPVTGRVSVYEKE